MCVYENWTEFLLKERKERQTLPAHEWDIICFDPDDIKGHKKAFNDYLNKLQPDVISG